MIGAQKSPAKSAAKPVDVGIAIFAAVCILGFAWFVYYLVTQQNADDRQWTRLTYLFNGVEAITFAAAGYLFGREVNRRRAETAEARAEQAENNATESNTEKIKLQTTAKNLDNLFQQKTAHLGRVRARAPDAAPQFSSQDVEELQSLIKTML